ncbi:unnamed protein product [Agarophyton chilense]
MKSVRLCSRDVVSAVFDFGWTQKARIEMETWRSGGELRWTLNFDEPGLILVSGVVLIEKARAVIVVEDRVDGDSQCKRKLVRFLASVTHSSEKLSVGASLLDWNRGILETDGLAILAPLVEKPGKASLRSRVRNHNNRANLATALAPYSTENTSSIMPGQLGFIPALPHVSNKLQNSCLIRPLHTRSPKPTAWTVHHARRPKPAPMQMAEERNQPSSERNDGRGTSGLFGIRLRTNGDVIKFGFAAIALVYAIKTGLQVAGVPDLLAGQLTTGFVSVFSLLAWISTYLFRVGSKGMTYAQQLRDYEDEVIKKRFEELTEEELAALGEELREDP